MKWRKSFRRQSRFVDGQSIVAAVDRLLDRGPISAQAVVSATTGIDDLMILADRDAVDGGTGAGQCCKIYQNPEKRGTMNKARNFHAVFS